MKCEKCNKEFSNYRALNGHKRTHGESQGRYSVSRKKTPIKQCKNCGEDILKRSANIYCDNKCFIAYQWKTAKLRIENGSGRVENIKKYLAEPYGKVCSECGCGDEWNGKMLTLQLDHIDGNSDNNSLSNVRLLCPNCHTQTDTYGMKGRGGMAIKAHNRNRYLREYKTN